ncbi:thiol reductant ABC exporter subunit CydD [Balneolales bacterium ANBcel1]|nr:thiol reductant ABC exporter subunit CydD [Balneolales bacterium ANBcel1]
MTRYQANHKKLFRLAATEKPAWIALGILSLLSASATIVLMYSLSVAVDAVFMRQASTDTIADTLYLLAAAIFVRGLLFWISEVVAQRSASRIKEYLRERLFEHMQRLGSGWTSRESSGELTATAVDGVEKLHAYYARFLPAGIHMMVVPAIIAVYVFGTDWLSGLILIVTGPLIPVFMSFIGMKAQDQTQKQWKTLGVLSSHFLDAVQGIRTLKIFNRTDDKQQEIADFSDRFRSTTMGVLKIAFLSGFVLELFASIATALVAVEIGVRLVEGHIGFQMGFFILLLAPEYYLPFRMFGAQHHAGMEGTEAAARIFEILETQPPENRETEPGSHISSPISIECKDVSFAYPHSNRLVLEKCSFQLEPGTVTALVGMSGSGKTTIARLLTRQYLPVSGEILVNNTPLADCEEESWLSQVALVRQGIWLFDDTVLNNLGIARPGCSFEEVVEAATAAEAHSFIQRMPNGYHTRLGEGAARLSGGERQRLGIARALLKDAPFVILDEPSSALDPESEHKISLALERLLAGRTVLIIAHRLSTVRRADHILVLDQGRIRSGGKHDELLETDLLYRSMVTAYREP